EEAIPQSLARAALTAIEAAGECVAILDQDGTTRYANTRFAQLVGKPLENIIGHAFADVISLVHRSDGSPAHRLLDPVLSGGPQIVLDHTLAVASGETSEDIIISAVPLQGDRARPEGAIVLIRRPLEMPLSPAELVASNRIEGLGQMASGIAHDFNNLLTTITGGINLGIQRKDWTSVQVAEKACRSAQTLARQLLTFARGPTGNRKVGDIRKTIEETTRMAAAGTSATIDLDLADDLHPVEFDPVQMVQVFTNLLINAVQALNDDGTIAIRAISVALAKLNALDLPPGDYVRIEIQDNGPGIAPEDLERIFQPFFTTRKDGTGLGLSVARSIIAQHNGTITVESTPGEGTTFTIHLPRANKDIVTEERTAPSLPRGSGRVLIMDDDTDLCMIATGILSMLGYEPDEAHNGEEAIKKYRRTMEIGRPYDVVILDLTVPGGMGGEAVLNELKKLDPQVCAVVSSGYVTEEQAIHYRSLGFAGILAKPYRTAELGQVLKDVLAARSNPDAE
ncbi:MAG: PAS domain-containing sensor histidine kinase, partial [Verrucomicrobia bacterium]